MREENENEISKIERKERKGEEETIPKIVKLKK